RRDGEMQLVDRPRAQVLPQRRDTAADAHVPALRGLERERPRALEAVGDEMKGRAAAHGQRRTCIVREDEDRAAERRLVAPPTGPALVGPGPADGAEHVAAENPGTDPVKAACDEVVVDAGLAALRAENALAKSARRHRPVVKRHGAAAHRVLEALRRPGAIAVDRDREAFDAHAWHVLLLPSATLRRMPMARYTAYRAQRGNRGRSERRAGLEIDDADRRTTVRDEELAGGNRQPEATRPCTAGVHVEDAVARLDPRSV